MKVDFSTIFKVNRIEFEYTKVKVAVSTQSIDGTIISKFPPSSHRWPEGGILPMVSRGRGVIWDVCVGCGNTL